MAEPTETTESAGGIGGSGALMARGRVSERSDARLIRRAIESGWNVSEDIKKLVVSQMALVVGRSDEERNRIAAARVLVAADAVDQRTELAAKETPQGNVSVKVFLGVDIEQV